jgi:hypothetical protein
MSYNDEPQPDIAHGGCAPVRGPLWGPLDQSVCILVRPSFRGDGQGRGKVNQTRARIVAVASYSLAVTPS